MAWEQNPAGFHRRTETLSAHVWPHDYTKPTPLRLEKPDHIPPVVWRWSIFTRKQGDDWRTVDNVAYGETVMIADAFAACEAVL